MHIANLYRFTECATFPIRLRWSFATGGPVWKYGLRVEYILVKDLAPRASFDGIWSRTERRFLPPIFGGTRNAAIGNPVVAYFIGDGKVRIGSKHIGNRIPYLVG